MVIRTIYLFKTIQSVIYSIYNEYYKNISILKSLDNSRVNSNQTHQILIHKPILRFKKCV